jgi:hypothetical protein
VSLRLGLNRAGRRLLRRERKLAIPVQITVRTKHGHTALTRHITLHR